MLDFKRFCVRMELREGANGSYTNWYVDATDALDAKERVRLLFGIKYRDIEVFGPFDNLVVQS